MAITTEKSGVEFTATGAIYRPGNGHTIHYRKVGGIFYHHDTPEAVVAALEQARSSRRRIRIYLGDVKTGRDWLEEHDVEGRIGNSMGPLRVPILVHNQRSYGGGAILNHCIVKVKWTSGGILYRHPAYHTGTFTMRRIESYEPLYAEGFTHAIYVDGKEHANFKSAAAAERFVNKLTS